MGTTKIFLYFYLRLGYNKDKCADRRTPFAGGVGTSITLHCSEIYTSEQQFLEYGGFLHVSFSKRNVNKGKSW